MIEQEKHTIIKEAIKEVYPEMYEEFNRADGQLYIPDEFCTPKLLSGSLSQQEKDEEIRFCTIAYSNYELMARLKKKGTLREKLGGKEEQQLYENFVVWNDNKTECYLNPNSTLQNILHEVAEEARKNEEEMQKFPISISDIKKRVNFKKVARKVLAPPPLNNPLLTKHQSMLDRKLLSNLTIREQIQKNIEKYAKETRNVLKFKFKIKKLGRTYAEKYKESIIENEIKVMIPRKKLIEYLSDEKYSKLQTKSKEKIKSMLYNLKDDEFLFLEEVNGRLDVQNGKLYRLGKTSLLLDGTDMETLYINVSDLDLDFPPKNYVYLDDDDFKRDEIAEQKFWEEWEEEIITNPDYKIDTGRINRIKSNGVFQAAHLKFWLFCRTNFPPTIPKTRLNLDNFDNICGIRDEAKKITENRKPKLEDTIVAIVRSKVLWIATDSLHWLHRASLKDGNVNLIFNTSQNLKTKETQLKI